MIPCSSIVRVLCNVPSCALTKIGIRLGSWEVKLMYARALSTLLNCAIDSNQDDLDGDEYDGKDECLSMTFRCFKQAKFAFNSYLPHRL